MADEAQIKKIYDEMVALEQRTGEEIAGFEPSLDNLDKRLSTLHRRVIKWGFGVFIFSSLIVVATLVTMAIAMFLIVARG